MAVATSSGEFLAKWGASGDWKPTEQDAWYYKIKAPGERMNLAMSVFVYPFLEILKLRTPQDPTYGRFTLPYSPRETAIREDPKITVWEARVYLDEHNKTVKGPSSRWVFYQVWSNEAAAVTNKQHADICFCHGINEYGGIISRNAKHFLDAGYRLIVPDLPSHGRSTGLHCFLPDLNVLALAVHVVLADVSRRDAEAGRGSQRKTVISGQSMGGFTSILYGLTYHSSQHKPDIETNVKPPNVVGVLALCPMLQIALDSRPSYFIELIARGISSVAGRLGLTPAHKGMATSDPWFEQECESDPQSYHGHLRVATGLAILKGIMGLEARAHEFTLPFKIIHGDYDRVTHPDGSRNFFARASTPDHLKEIVILPRHEHILLRRGRDDEDDQKRQKVIDEMLGYIGQRVRDE